MDNEFDGVIDPDIEGALDEAIRTPVQDGVAILTLLNEKKIKIRYKPMGMAAMMEAANGTPTSRKSKDFSYSRWGKEVLSKLNKALLNIQIVDDLSGKRPSGRELPFSLIPPGEYYRLYELCFPGYSIDPADSGDKDNAGPRKTGKGVSRGPANGPGDEERPI